jgi:hypothetical protein
MAKEMSKERLKEITGQLLATITSEQFLAKMAEVRNAPEGERMKAAAFFLSVDALRNSGLDVPTDFRVASRYFEEHFDPPGPATPTAKNPTGAQGPVTPLGVCAGGGMGTVCGCAGNTVAFTS